MEILKAATEWAKAEITSSIIFIIFGIVYIIGSVVLWKIGNAPLAKATFVPLLIAGVLLIGAGVGFYVSNTSKLKNFESEYNTNPAEFIRSEMVRTENTMKTYENVALKVFPLLIVLAALVAFFIPNIRIRSICIAVIAFFVVLVLMDSQALKRMKTYHSQLKLESIELKK